MAKKNDLDFLIDDINMLSTQGGMNDTLEVEINEMIVSALEEIGVRTITDTNQAKSIFVDICREHLGVDISYIYEPETNIWGNKRDAYDFSDYEVYEDRLMGRNFSVLIEDYGLEGQEFNDFSGKEYPSPIRDTLGLPTDYKPHHITTVVDMVNDGNLAKFEFWVNKVQDRIIKYIETGR